ncbi:MULTISPECIES: hypothetical protein [Clavibacter]|uniref:Uncharacterized protein n=2 Tax=Clavibacter TaxID=1573 RepID=A0A399NL97_9MICO|nr:MULTISPECIES: hypothetical protein [Clavibacter]KDP91386.1 hypothetical protein W824_06740 [Clavibacter cf. michiganensis LMG 26808]RII94935.1 hypothetical protein DZF96_14815 [Clavibacter michiganensis]UKF25817.1 hypothetical protein KYT88_03705 [Clavibacter sp. A6099]
MERGTEVMGTRGVRVARGVVTSGVAILVAAVSHMAGGGEAPGVVGVVIAAAFALPVSTFLAGRTISVLRLAIAVAFSQGAFHLLFSVGAATTASTRMVGGHHGMGGSVLTTVAGGGTETAAMAGMHHGPGMWAAHVLAAAVTCVALRFGERAFWDLVALARTALVVVLHAVALLASPAGELRHRVPAAWHPGLPDTGVALSSMPRRGPPASA